MPVPVPVHALHVQEEVASERSRNKVVEDDFAAYREEMRRSPEATLRTTMVRVCICVCARVYVG